MRIGITANPEKPGALALARQATTYLDGRAEVVLSDETEAHLRLHRPAQRLEEMAVDAIVAIGGDGTFLHVLQRSRRPLLPINAGTVGFLAEIDGPSTASFEGALERLVRGSYYLEERMRLASELAGAQLPDATNEIVVHTDQVAQMRLFEILIDGRPVGRLRADGVIVATATGSTSYASSAMGPILDPNVEAIVLATLAPYLSAHRSIVIDALRTVAIRLVGPGKGGVVVVDGQSEVPLPGNGIVTAYRSPRKAEFIRFGGRFFRRLQGKGILPWEGPGPGGSEDDADLPPAA